MKHFNYQEIVKALKTVNKKTMHVKISFPMIGGQLKFKELYDIETDLKQWVKNKLITMNILIHNLLKECHIDRIVVR